MKIKDLEKDAKDALRLSTLIAGGMLIFVVIASGLYGIWLLFIHASYGDGGVLFWIFGMLAIFVEVFVTFLLLAVFGRRIEEYFNVGREDS